MTMIGAGQPTMLFDDRPLVTVAGFGTIILLQYVAIAFHEFGHWVAARLCGFRVLGFSVGEGRRIWRRQSGETVFDFRLVPIEGQVLPARDSGTITRSQDFAVSAAGPLCTFLFLLALIAGRSVLDLSALGEPWHRYVGQILVIAMMLTGISLLYNLIPHQGIAGLGQGANDGRQMLTALLAPGYPRLNHYQASMRRLFPEDRVNLPETRAGRTYFTRMVSLGWQREPEHAAALALQASEDPSLPEHERTLFQFELAELALSGSERRLHRRAFEILEEACESQPENILLRSRRAALKVELQFYDEGRRELEALTDDSRTPEMRAFALAYLAIAAARQRDGAGAERLYREAKQVDPYQVPLLAKAAREVFHLSAGYAKNIGRDL